MSVTDAPFSSDADAAPSLVRPYTLTAGRTKSGVAVPLEATIETTGSTRYQQWAPSDIRGDIVRLCAHRPAVAEIAARLEVPLGVACVLVGDLVGTGHLRVMTTLDDESSTEDRRDLIGRTLRGLRAL